MSPEKLSMAEEDQISGRSHFRGHPIIYIKEQWFYEDNKKPIPGWGGENRPCIKCGSSKWSGEGEVDECLGVLPGVTNACCGHGIQKHAYICFENGVVLRGFKVSEKLKGKSNGN